MNKYSVAMLCVSLAVCSMAWGMEIPVNEDKMQLEINKKTKDKKNITCSQARNIITDVIFSEIEQQYGKEIPEEFLNQVKKYSIAHSNVVEKDLHSFYSYIYFHLTHSSFRYETKNTKNIADELKQSKNIEENTSLLERVAYEFTRRVIMNEIDNNKNFFEEKGTITSYKSCEPIKSKKIMPITLQVLKNLRTKEIEEPEMSDFLVYAYKKRLDRKKEKNHD